jgi:hypothetical protein
MKKITKAVFSSGRQLPAAVVLTSATQMLACTENHFCAITEKGIV